jgi:hypothetical protein
MLSCEVEMRDEDANNIFFLLKGMFDLRVMPMTSWLHGKSEL